MPSPSLGFILVTLFLLVSTIPVMSSMPSLNPTVSELMAKGPTEVASYLEGIYEHSAWVAEELSKCDLTQYTTVTKLAEAMKAIVEGSSYDQKLELLRAHPDLCEKVGRLEALTMESQEEQSRSGLQSLTEEELTSFNHMNEAYRTKCGFPFILAVRNASKQTVLAALEGRLQNSVETEFTIAMQQVHKIAWMRLLTKLSTDDANGFLTCHVLDTANGIPAQKMRITLTRLSPPETAGVIGEFVTNDDGRLEGGPALKGGKEFTVGVYEWTFYVGDVSLFRLAYLNHHWINAHKSIPLSHLLLQYFASKGTFTSGQPFIDVVPLRFGIDNPDDHYHVPLLVSPWSFSTYRGS